MMKKYMIVLMILNSKRLMLLHQPVTLLRTNAVHNIHESFDGIFN